MADLISQKVIILVFFPVFMEFELKVNLGSSLNTHIHKIMSLVVFCQIIYSLIFHDQGVLKSFQIHSPVLPMLEIGDHVFMMCDQLVDIFVCQPIDLGPNIGAVFWSYLSGVAQVYECYLHFGSKF